MNQPLKLKPLTWPHLMLLFGIPTLLNGFACQIAIPYFTRTTDLPIEVVYFLSVGLIVLAPMLFGAVYLAGKDIGGYKFADIMARMRIKRLDKTDWVWLLAGFIGLCLASFLIAKLLMPALGLNASPFFFQNMPLAAEYMYILYVWPLFFLLNIIGEEFLWRGYIQPRQELLTGKYTWLVHGAFWSIWHFPMGLTLVFAASPTLFILPFIVQIRKNTSIAIIIHALFGAMGFLVLAFGLVE